MEQNLKTTPVLLLTGYLGAGKTTLLNHILSNQKGIRFAVIVNDIGEVNIDASLIQKGGIVDQKDDSLVAMQNGCICCTLKMDLVKQIQDILAMNKFDYIVIEASGICEPEPIAQTICSIQEMSKKYYGFEITRLDSVITVVDALRMASEFGSGDALTREDIEEEEDIESLLIQQIEFCNTILLNKASEVSEEDLKKIEHIIDTLNPGVEVIRCDYADVEMEKLVNTRGFDFEKVALSPAWVGLFDKPLEDIEDEEEGETDEYGISTFVYYRRPAFDYNKFDHFVAKSWPKSVIRAKGVCYFGDNPDMSYLFEQAGVQKTVKEAGQWLCTAPADELRQMVEAQPQILNDFDEKWGDRMVKIVFIGQNMDREQICADLDFCLDENVRF